tara:strand:+ start:15756 stop:16007 length:252 start_codon:yes stop_codon:yes gene_type:complete
MDVIYLVFGSDPSEAAEEQEWDECVKHLNNGAGEMVVYPSHGCRTPIELLGIYDGWDGFFPVSEDIFRKLEQKIKYPNLEIFG